MAVSLKGQDGQQSLFTLVPLEVSFEVLVVDVPQPSLQVPLLRNRGWKRRDSLMISDGDIKTASETEVIPYVLTQALILRNLDVTFDVNARDYANFANRIEIASAGTVSSIPFALVGQGAAFCLPGHLYLPRPQVLAGVIATPPKSPDPDDKLIWK